MSKDSRSAQGISTPSKKSFGKNKKGSGSADKRPTASPDSNSKSSSKERKGSARSKKHVKDHHHKKDMPKKDEEKHKKESEKEKKNNNNQVAAAGSSKTPVKKEKEQNSNMPTEFEEIKVARRPAVSKTKRKHLVVGEDTPSPPGTPATPVVPGQTSQTAAPVAEEGLSTPQTNDAGKGGSGSLDPDSSGRVPGGPKHSGEIATTPESDRPVPIPGIKLSKELIKHGSKEYVKGGSKENHQQPKPGSKEFVHSDSLVPKTINPRTPGIIQNLPMLPEENEAVEKKQ